MFGIGLGEILLLAVIAVLVFGAPAVIGYFIGYNAGQRRASETDGRQPDPAEEAPHE